MITRTLNKMTKVAFQMSKYKKMTPDDSSLPKEAQQQIKIVQQQVIQQAKSSQQKIDADLKKTVKWKNLQEKKNNKKQQKWIKKQKGQKFYKAQHKPEVKAQDKQQPKFEKTNEKYSIFKSNKKYFIDSLEIKNKIEKDLQNSQLKEIDTSINNAIKNFKTGNLQQTKNSIEKIRNHKLFKQGINIFFQEILTQDFKKIAELLKMLNLKPVQGLSHFLEKILFVSVKEKNYKKIIEIFEFAKNNKENSPAFSIQFLDYLFFEEINQQIDYLYGENSVKYFAKNHILVQKIKLAQSFLRQFHKKNNNSQNQKHPQIVLMPKWFLKLSQIIKRYDFGKKQFESLFTQLFTHHSRLIPSWFYQSKQMLNILNLVYFGKQEKLKEFFDILFVHSPKFHFKQFYENLKNSIMSYRSQHGVPAFTVNQDLINKYKSSYFTKNKNMLITCLLIAQDSNYPQLMTHYLKYHSQIFFLQGVASQLVMNVQELIMNNYNSVTQAQLYEKKLQTLQRSGPNKLIKIKAAIKLGNLSGAYKMFCDQYLKPVAIQRQRKNIQFVLKTRLGQQLKYFLAQKDIGTFVTQLNSQYLWALHKRTQDFSSMMRDYLPQDKFSFWDQTQKKQRYDQVVKLKYSGKLDKQNQPQADIQKDGFNLNQYVSNELLKLQQQQKVSYEKQKQIIRFKIKADSLNDLIRVKPDKFVYQKLKEYQQELSQQSLAILQSFGLKDYDIVEYGWTQFNERLQKMIIFNNIPKDENALVNLQIEQISEKKKKGNSYSSQKIQDLLIKCPQDFKEAYRLVNLPADPIVQTIMLWGVYTKQPMAIYLGQKLAMLTGQIISHEIAKKVSNLLSYRRHIQEQFINKCKQSLQIVGKINRQNIYDMNKDYHHILFRRQMAEQMVKLSEQKVSTEKVQDLLEVNPFTGQWQQQPIYFVDTISRRKSDYI